MPARLLLCLALLFSVFRAVAQDDSPYARFGYEGKVLRTPQERQQRMMMLVPNTDTASAIAKVGLDPANQRYYLFDKHNQVLQTDTLTSTEVARFLSVDPLTKSYPWYTPYQFAGNKPIWATDLDGLEEFIKDYRLENGKVLMLGLVNNTVVQGHRILMGGNSVTTNVLYNKTTGQKLTQAEVGQVQYRYFDTKGQRLQVRRDYDGNYAPGQNEMMPVGENNYFGSIYIGPDNPTATVNGREIPDYRREPQDAVDAAALRHDKGYDAVNAAGVTGATQDPAALPADIRLVQDAEKVKSDYQSGRVDNYTGKPISPKTESRASKVSSLFQVLIYNKVR